MQRNIFVLRGWALHGRGARQLLLAVAALSALAVACTEREATAPVTVPVGGVTAEITCQAFVNTGTLSCGTATPVRASDMSFDVILGGQGLYVQLISSGTAYDAGTQIFSSNVTVKDLIAQPMGTADGTTADAGGIKVLFNSGPNVTGGAGTVTVSNPDGVGTFTATQQPYFQYPGPLAPGATSASKSWQFTVPSTVSAFDFTVFVHAKLPADASVLLWQ